MPISPNKITLIHVNNMPIEVRSYNRSKNVTIRIDRDMSVIISKPLTFPLEKVSEIVLDKFNWIIQALNKTKSIVNQNCLNYSKSHYFKNKSQAYNVINRRLIELNSRYKFAFNKIYIKNQSSRWGSCSKNNNLNFNYKIVFLPTNLMDYVIVHELCHLKEFNHSKNFWGLVSQTIPDYKQVRKKLRTYTI